MISTVPAGDLPGLAGNRLYLDYIAGAGEAAAFYSHGPLDFAAALAARRRHSYPRREVGRLLGRYNAGLGAGAPAMANIEALADEGTFCVISGNQAGFLGGPVYTAYKIITTIRLAEALQARLGVRVVPVYWVASEDHDFHEINHAYFLKSDGEVGRVRFNWASQGNPVADLPVAVGCRRAYEAYFEQLAGAPHAAQTRALFAPAEPEDYCTWQARLWSRLFADRGLVLVEPRAIRAAGGAFMRFALEQVDEIDERLRLVRQRLAGAGYEATLTSERAGCLYTIDGSGRRVRVQDPRAHLDAAVAHPGRYSTDAALRPLFADSLLPVLADVLGAGELAYQGMLAPLYELFSLPQPVLFPRKHYTVVGEAEACLLERYGISAEEVIRGHLDLDATFRGRIPPADLEAFEQVRLGLEQALAPLRPHVEAIDPSLGNTWQGALTGSLRAVAKLERRAMKAKMSRMRYSKQELQRLRNLLLPRGRLQERVFPLPHFLSRHGPSFIERLFSAGRLEDFSHHILTLEGGDAGR